MSKTRQAGTHTRLDPEDYAYNTYSGAHSRSNRHGRAIYPDGQVRAVTAGVADSFWTIPAHGRIGGKYVSGHLTVSDQFSCMRDEEWNPAYPQRWPGCTEEGEYLFTITSDRLGKEPKLPITWRPSPFYSERKAGSGRRVRP